MRGFKLSCCDCRLTHVLNFRLSNGRVQIQFTRDERATAAMRRAKQKE